ncbi:collagen-like triple helix repeat-containing protein [Lactococcus lactis]|uniref:collagen-like triple helix repeat-containing protein n=1 Tax=Lactococcus lactis TaxID=1358 RepID=UPI003D0D6DD2
MVKLIASNQLTLTNLNEKAIDRTEISFWHGLSATKYPLGVYDCGNRDHQYGNEFNVTSGKTYTVRVIAKQTKGSLGLRGGIWYTAMTSGTAWDGLANFTLVGEVSEDGLGVYERKFAVESGKTKAKLFIQIDQWLDSSDRTTWRIYDGQVFDENGQPLVTDQNNYGALTSPMATPNGTYIWKRTITYYTDGTRNTIWEYSGVGKDGTKGDKGDTGERGLQGEKGEQGIPGSKGADGKTQYTHIAYANIKFLCEEAQNFTLSEQSIVRFGVDTRWVYKELQAGTYTATWRFFGSDPASGVWKHAELVSNFSTSNSINTTHIGVYVDFVESNSVDPSKYNWTLVKGADGTQGTPGKAGADGRTPYFHTAYAYSADSTDRFTTVYPNLNLGDNTKKFTNAEGGNNLNGSIRIDPATQKTQDGDFYYLTFKPTIDGYDWFRFFLIPDTVTPNMTKVTVKPNTKYTFSVLLKGTGQHTIFAYNSWTAPNTPWYLQINLTSDWKLYTFTVTSKDVIPNSGVQFFIRSNNGTEINLKKPKVEQGSIATPYMPSSSEVKTSDYPSYIGQYTDFTQADSTNPSAYTWSLIRGNDGKDGATGPAGPPGSTGAPGKIVSNTEPTTKFKGLTWKYSGTAKLTASDGTVINPNTEYYYNGTHWVINYFSANNFEANSITADLIDAKNLTITDGEFVSTIIEGSVKTQTEIKDDHLLIYKMDTSHNDITTIALKSDSGLGMTYQNADTSQYTSSGINLQGIFTQDNILKNGVSLTPGGVKFTQNGVSAGLNFDGTNLSSSMPIQAPNTIVKSTYFSVSGIGIRLDRMMSFVAVTFSGQASSTINTSPTVNNVLPVGFRPISPYSIDYMVPGNVANSGYIYFNPDGSIRIMATINKGYYIRGTRLYITSDVYPS